MNHLGSELGSVCIIGNGLIGGSLLRDLAARGVRVFGSTHSEAAAARAVAEGFEVSSSLIDVLSRAESELALIVVAVPFDAVASVLDAIAEHAPSCGVTDVVSVKAPVLELVAQRGMRERYVGGHPMAGTAESGWAATQTGLFQGAAWVVAYDYARECAEAGPSAGQGAGGRVPDSWVRVFGQVCRMVALVGAEAVPVTARKHDETVARISHLPHVIAEALAVTGDRGGPMAQSLAAGSFAGATRVAGTRPVLVRNMCETNAAPLVEVLDEYIALLNDARASLAGNPPSMQALAEAGHTAHERMSARSGARRESVSPVAVSSRPVMRVHPGAPGWVAQLEQIEALGGRVEVF